jgi:signal transduction histidine kinase
MKFPKVVAAQRLQTWLLVTAFVALVVTGLLVFDLARNLRTVVISEATRLLTGAADELLHAARESRVRDATSYADGSDRELRLVSYEVLRSYPDVEGGYLWDDKVIGHSFPTYTEPLSALRQPDFERDEVLSALAESRSTGRVATRVAQDGKDLVLVAVLVEGDRRLAAWSLRRIFGFSDSSELTKRFLLVFAMVVGLIAIGAVLRLSFGLQHGFQVIQEGLSRLRTDLDFRLPEQNHELRTIVQSVNTMAESRQKLEAALRRDDRLRVMGRVVAGIAHEIRNPLNSIRLTIRVLARRLQGRTDAAETIDLITAEIDRLDSLLKTLLAFRADEQPKIRRQPIHPILDRTLALVGPHASEHGVAVRVESAEEAEAFIDSDLLQQALMNVLLNAIDASGQMGDVSVRLQTANSHVEILVTDSGPGLDLEQQDRIFEPFYTTKPTGTGLGLAVTKTLLERMGALVECQNTALGACFRILLPAGEER